MKVLPCGDRALLAEFDSLDAALDAHTRWVQSMPPGVIELVPAARTVLVRVDPTVFGLTAAQYWLEAHASGDSAARTSRALGGDPTVAPDLVDLPVLQPSEAFSPVVFLPVVYDGDDLAVVAEAWGCPPSEVAERHAAIEWVCAFIGFAPGFAYLIPSPGAAAMPPVPRRATSRSSVSAGAVALAAEYCAVYPQSSPGGWQLIGRTSAVLWDSARASPALVTPGARVRFEAVRV
jgi:KipI family sensor histidine kinase inhibitor